MIVPRTVLLLDDDAQFRASVTPALEAFGLRVLSATKGSVARAMLEAEEPSLLVVDGLLPDTNGILWIEELRNDGFRTPIIFVSAFYRDLATFKHLTRDLEVLKVIHKPVSVDRFAREVASTVAPPSFAPSQSDRPGAADDWDDEETLLYPGDPSAQAKRDHERLRQSYQSILPVAADNLTGIVHQVQVQPERSSLLSEALRQANDLHGTAGSYGLSEISEAAAEIESLLRELQQSGRVDWALVYRSIEQVRKEAARVNGNDAAGGPRAAAPPSVTPAAAFLLHEPPVPDDFVPSLLVLEDDPAMLAYLRSAFDDVLLHLHATASVEEALHWASRNPPSAVLLGWPLADRSAPARFVQLLRGLRGCAEVPVLMLSVDDDAATLRFASELGVDMFLTHPIELVRLHQAVDAAVERACVPALQIAVLRDREAAIEIESTGLRCLLYFSVEELIRQSEVHRPDVILLGADVNDPHTASVLRMCAWDSEFALLSFEQSPVAESSQLDGRLDREAGWIVELHRHAERVARMRRVPFRCRQTGLLMSPGAVSALEAGLSAAQRHGHTYSIGFIRTLGLKELEPLRAHRLQTFLGRLIAGRFRREDVRGRWNEDTFVVGFDGSSARAVVTVVQRLQVELESEHARLEGLAGPHIAVGLAAYPLDGDTHRALVHIAHERLEAAVEQGPGSLIWR